jgi:hypothetical protein
MASCTPRTRPFFNGDVPCRAADDRAARQSPGPSAERAQKDEGLGHVRYFAVTSRSANQRRAQWRFPSDNARIRSDCAP